jgi:predicted PurR-regulated permease PerM
MPQNLSSVTMAAELGQPTDDAARMAMIERSVLTPLLAFAPQLADQLVSGAQRVQMYFAATPDQPTWIKGVPLFGRRLGAAWDRIVEVRGNLRALLEPYTANLEQLMIGAARALADSVVQVLLSLVVATTFWTNGDGLVAVLHPERRERLKMAVREYLARASARSGRCPSRRTSPKHRS